jgi:hypothetical protein
VTGAPSRDPVSGRSRRADRLLHLGAIALVTVLAYSDSFDGQFVSDDTVSVRDKAEIRSLDLAHLRAIFTTFDDANYMPVKVLTFAIDYRFWGLDPTGYHLTNLLVHVACALVVYLVLTRLALPPPAACLVALLWAVHPLQVESVAWISERKNVLSGLFFFAAFLAYLRFSDRPRAGTYAGLLVLHLLALLSKMNTMVLPALCLAYEVGVRGRLRGREVAAALPMLALGAAVAWYNLAGNPIHGSAWHGGSMVVSWLSSAVVFFRYLGKIALPLGLSPFYEVPLRDSPLDPPVLLSLLGLGALAAASVALLRRRRPEVLWIAWYVVCLLPMLNIVVPFRALMHDRYMYLPMLGPLALAATLVSRLPSRRWRRVAAAGAVAAVAACAVLTYRQVAVWRDTFTLWEPVALRYAAYAGEPGYTPEDLDRRIAYLEAALARDPLHPIANNNLAAQHIAVGRIADALPLLERAARHRPSNAYVLANLATAYLHAGRLEEAERAATGALRADPYFFPPLLTRLRVHLMRGDVERARQDLERCRQLRPRPEAASMWRREQAHLERLEAARGTAGPGSPR